MRTSRTEEYLEAIFKLQEKNQNSITIGQVAEHLKLSPPSASEMIKRLKRSGMVRTANNREIELTVKGKQEASQVIRRHRLSERLLTDFLGFEWDKVHEEACKLEHVISSEMEDKLEKNLGFPRTCPHGYPIPNKQGKYERQIFYPLSSISSGQTVTVARVSEDKPEVLKYLSSVKLDLGRKVKVRDISMAAGVINLEIDKKVVSLGLDVAKTIMVSQ
jgi:DtxR family Mn-dependent transcriptional regulator